MANSNAAYFGPASVDTGSVAIAGTGAFVSLGIISLGGVKQGALLLLSNLGANALTGLKISRAATAGGQHVDWLAGTDFNTATAELLDVVTGSSPPNIHLLASLASGEIKLDRLEGVAEIQAWAKAATATTVQLTGTAY